MLLPLLISPLAFLFLVMYVFRSSKNMARTWREFVIDLKYLRNVWQAIFVDNKMRSLNRVDLVSLPNKVAVLTGGNRGIGLCVLEKLLKCDMTVVLGIRNPEASGIAVVKALGDDLTRGKVFYEKCDTGDMDSVKQFAKNVQERFSAVHLLINNAGVMSTPYTETRDGFESQMAINYLGHFLLTHLLMPQIIKGSKDNDGRNARIVNVSSCLHLATEISYDDFHFRKFYYPIDPYAKSKLAQVLFTKSLEKMLAERQPSVQVHAVHPGVVNTDLLTNIGTIECVRKLLIKTPEEGSRTVVYAAISPKLEGKEATYVSNCTVSNYHEAVNDERECKKLFEFTCQLLKIDNFGMLK